MNEIYDVAVVGAGPAGSSCAKACAEKGLSVILLEKANKAGARSVCGGLLPGALLKEFDIPQSLLERRMNGFFMYLPNGRKVSLTFSDPGATTNRSKFDEFLCNEAVRSGVKLKTSGDVTHVEILKDSVLLTVNGAEKLRAKLVVVANGPHSRLVKDLLGDIYSSRNFAVGLQRHYPLKKGYDFTHFEVYHDPSLGYGLGWISAYSKTAAIGVGLLHSQAGDIKKKHAEFVTHYDISSKVDLSKPLKEEAAIIPFHTFSKKLYSDRSLIIGDAAMLCNPFSGDGIYYAMKSGLFAADSASEALRDGDFSSSKLSSYQRAIEKEFRISMDLSFKMQKMIYSSPKFAEAQLSSTDKSTALLIEKMIWTKELKSMSFSEKLNMLLNVIKTKIRTIK